MIWNDVPCKEWTGARLLHPTKRTPTYGVKWSRVHGRAVAVHRLAWEEAHGPIPPGKKILHHCDNPPCYEIAHLFAGTQADNVADMHAKGRGKVGLFNKQKTHCKEGHEYTVDNTYLDAQGWRHCRICRGVAERKSKPRTGPRVLKTHCPKGHPYSGDNLYTRPNGRRDCKECHLEAGRQSWAEKKVTR